MRTLRTTYLFALGYLMAEKWTGIEGWTFGCTRKHPRRSFCLQANSEEMGSVSRRKYFQSACRILCLPAMIPAVSNAADDRLFRQNPLTNPVLEQFRVWDQAEADQIKYGGELERGDAKLSSADQYAKLLVPILQIANDLERIEETIKKEDQLVGVQEILSQPTYKKIQMKKVFNSFADNIYYSDPDRANVYLAGGAVPNAEQSIAYLLRNDILTAIEDMQAEVEFLVKNVDEPKDDLFKYSKRAITSMEQYLKIIPPAEVEKARAILTSRSL